MWLKFFFKKRLSSAIHLKSYLLFHSQKFSTVSRILCLLSFLNSKESEHKILETVILKKYLIKNNTVTLIICFRVPRRKMAPLVTRALSDDSSRRISWKKIYTFLFKKEHLRFVCPECKKDDSEFGDVAFSLLPKEFDADQAGKR